MNCLKKGMLIGGRIGLIRMQQQEEEADHHRAKHLRPEFLPCREAEIALLRYFGVVVDEADGPEGEDAEQRQPDVGVAQVRPQKCRHDDRDDDQQAAHGRRTSFFAMRLRTFLANLLAEAPFAQFANHERPEQEPQSQAVKLASATRVVMKPKTRNVGTYLWKTWTNSQ